MSLNDEQRARLVAAARAVRENAYAPASHFLVGAAVLYFYVLRANAYRINITIPVVYAETV